MVGTKLYVEGGGDTMHLRAQCREGFACFLERAGCKGRMPRIVACGSRQNAFDRFRTAVKEGESALLLIDSEGLVDPDSSPWTFLQRRQEEGFDRPDGATDDQCHLMVVCMEAWFLADREALAAYFGQNFNLIALPQHSHIEAISKQDIHSGLRAATARCKAKYDKGRHSFKILATISPERVRASCPWAQRFLGIMLARPRTG